MPATPKTVLIVEDERPIAHALELKLQHEGFQTEIVQDGQQAIEILEHRNFDVMLLDLMMPVMDGFQVLERISKSHKVNSVIVLSNLSQHEDEERSYELGAQKYFVKTDTPLSKIVEEVKNI